MAIELLLDNAPGPAPLALALELGRASLPLAVRALPRLTAATARDHPEALLLLPAAEYAILQDSHVVLPALAAGGRHSAAAVLVGDRRLDEVDAPLVDLDAISLTTECLARATLRKFYGITGEVWTRDGRSTNDEVRTTNEERGAASDERPAPGDEQAGGASARARRMVEVREGGVALHLLDQPGDAVVEDLGRAWFILTGLPCVSHLLVAPRALLAAEASRLQELADDALPRALAAVREHQDELRRGLCDRFGVSREVLDEFYDDQFSTLTGDAQKAAVALFERGARGMGLPRVARLNLLPGAPRV